MRRLILILMLGATTATQAQNNLHSIHADVINGFSFMTYKDDELVAPRRRGNGTFGDEWNVDLYETSRIGKKNLILRVGAGFGQKHMSMNRTNFGDFIIRLFTFGNGDRDSFRLNRVRWTAGYLSVSTGISSRLTKNEKHAIQFFAGLVVKGNMVVSRKADIIFDTTYRRPTMQEQEEAKQKYESTIAGFACEFQPRIYVEVRISKGLGLGIGLWPFLFFTNSWNRPIARNTLSFVSTMGVHYNF